MSGAYLTINCAASKLRQASTKTVAGKINVRIASPRSQDVHAISCGPDAASVTRSPGGEISTWRILVRSRANLIVGAYELTGDHRRAHRLGLNGLAPRRDECARRQDLSQQVLAPLVRTTPLLVAAASHCKPKGEKPATWHWFAQRRGAPAVYLPRHVNKNANIERRPHLW